MSVSRPFSVILLTASALALILLVTSMTRVLERGEADLVDAQIGFVLADLDQTIERNLSLGLPLSELQPIERILEQTVANNSDLLAIEVLSPTGIALYSTDRGAVGEPIPPAWEQAIEDRQAGRPWRVDHLGTVVIGTSIENDFGQTAGWITLILDDSVQPPAGHLLPGILLSSSPYLLGGLVLALILAIATGTGMARHFRRLARQVDRHGELNADADPATMALPLALSTVAHARHEIDTCVETLRQIDGEI
ncbi:hypothetical protein AB7M35_003304 [Amorphus suaedae]